MVELLGELLTVPLVYAIGIFIIINNEGWEGIAGGILWMAVNTVVIALSWRRRSKKRESG
jgi:hypothetical protein